MIRNACLTVLIIILLVGPVLVLVEALTPQPCAAAACPRLSCIDHYGCSPPCFCAKQQGEAFGFCSGAG